MRIIPGYSIFLWIAFVAAACGDDSEPASGVAASVPASPTAVADISTFGDLDERLTPEQIEAGRMNMGWRQYASPDSIIANDTLSYPESWEDISASAVNGDAMFLPLHGDVAGPSVLRVQVLLDRAYFSPGIIDGRWGMNTEKAIYWLQEREGLAATGRVDEATFARLVELAGGPQQIVTTHTLSAEDVSGPFVTIPEDIYEKAEMECMCYESLSEKLSEMFHITPATLGMLNPDVDLNQLQAGDVLNVPNVTTRGPAPQQAIAQIVISDGGHYIHALDASGRTLYHFPTTLGSDYAPSPTGKFTITNIAHDPTWHYQPELLTGVPDEKEDAIIPPGPNNAVGVVWMQLSKPHYGIHGTSAPETIGYTTSHGCVRLTNWDARFLAEQVDPGVAVHFRDITSDA